jgi:hypothetical protein
MSQRFRKGKRQQKPDIGNEDLPKTGKPRKWLDVFKKPDTPTAITEAARAPPPENSSTKLESLANENSKPSKRDEAEKLFKEATNNLQNAISKQKTSLQLQEVPEAIGLQTSSPIKDVEGTARLLESFIEDYVTKLGDLKRSEGKVKEFTKRWFMISFKYVTPVLNVAKVCDNCLLLMQFSRDLFLVLTLW